MTTPIGTGLIPESYYSCTYNCTTVKCKNYLKVMSLAQVYDNGGDLTNCIYCGKCGHLMVILSCTYLDPQPIISPSMEI